MADFAIVIGIENYLTTGIGKVRYAEADAQAVASALEKLGFTVDCILLSEKATKNTMAHKISDLLESLQSGDRVLLYYAGHGFAEVGNTILSCSDSILKKIGDTGIRVSWIMDRLEESACDKAMFFFDACHAGATTLKADRSVLDTMSDAEMKDFFAKAEHKVCFAACKFNQTSVSSSKLQHGVWTFYLLKTLRGEVKSALQKGRYLTASNLQNYLSQEVPLAAKAARTDDHKQTPMMYGAQTAGDFSVADLQQLLDEQEVSSADDPLLLTATFRAQDEVSVKDLGGFRRGNRVPDEIADYADNFIRRIASEDVKGRVEAWAQKFRSALKLKRTEMRVEEDRIITNDFEYAIWCEQSVDEAGEAVFYEELSKVSPTLRVKPAFDELFTDAFDRMVISPSKSIDVMHVIDTLEALDTDRIDVKYPADAKRCTVRFIDSNLKLIVTRDEILVLPNDLASPNELAEAFLEAGTELKELAGAPVLLLN
jgi:uncharacterized caspase-like protein